MCIVADAMDNGIYTYDFDGTEITVEIEDNSISAEKKESIAKSLLGNTESDIMVAYIWCDLFGHEYKYTTATVIEHKVNKYNPRCKTKLYDVTYCNDCDYTEQTLLATSFINCCPEE
jgi:hypothetical protein